MATDLNERVATWLETATHHLQFADRTLTSLARKLEAFRRELETRTEKALRFDPDEQAGPIALNGAGSAYSLERWIGESLNYEQFDDLDLLVSVTRIFGPAPGEMDRSNPSAELSELRQEIEHHSRAFQSFRSGTNDRDAPARVLEQLLRAPTPTIPPPTPGLFYVPAGARTKRLQIAGWVLVPLLVTCLAVGEIWPWLIFGGALLFFGGMAAHTNSADEAHSLAVKQADVEAKRLKDSISAFSASAIRVLAQSVLYAVDQLNQAASAASTELDRVAAAAGRATEPATAPGQTLGQVCLPPIQSYLCKSDDPLRFDDFAYASLIHVGEYLKKRPAEPTNLFGRWRDHGFSSELKSYVFSVLSLDSDEGLTERVSPKAAFDEDDLVVVRGYAASRALTADAIAALPFKPDRPVGVRLLTDADERPPLPFTGSIDLTECDRIDIDVSSSVDAGSIAREFCFDLLMASPAGHTRFLFIEPGRLAEAYRVFGALNESESTRLIDRLFVTHVSELASAVDGLRNFVGRTKEAMTRKTAEERRITRHLLEGESASFLQRAVVVVDRSEQARWPEKDRRRISELLEELVELAAVGSSEASVLLVQLTREHDVERAGLRSVILKASEGAIQVGEDIVIKRGPAIANAEIASRTDDWAKLARGSGRALKQTAKAADWSDPVQSNSRYGVEVEIGRHGADRPAILSLGGDQAHHAICIGRTGSGKTNLLHVIITNLVRRYSPSELELYLLDFKEGVEFSIYADLNLPHCRAIATEADRGFGMSVLSFIRKELGRRASVFQAAGVGITNLEKYEEHSGKNMPRIVLVIDEFQVLLQGAERTAGSASGAAANALEDIVRRGRSFGVHVILGSQTLAGRELTSATLGQLGLRIVLPCSPADATALLGEQTISNQLRTPGDAIVWRAGQGEVSDAHLAKIYSHNHDDLVALVEGSRTHSETTGEPSPAPFIFRGSGQNEISDVLPHLVRSSKASRSADDAMFALGAATTFGEHPVGRLSSRRARNVLFVHRDEEIRVSFGYSAIESFLELTPQGRLICLDFEGATDFEGRPMSERLIDRYGDRAVLVSLASVAEQFSELLKGVEEGTSGGRTMLAILGAQQGRLSTDKAFGELLKLGPEASLHILATCDAVRNLERLADRSALKEFGLRVLGPAGAAESLQLLNSNDAELLSSDHQYLILDEEAPNRLVRAQALVSSLQRVQQQRLDQGEIAHV